VSGDFLSRWSRRKQQARRAEPDPEPQAVEPAETPTLPEALAGEPALSPEEIEELPTIETLTAESDVSAFLRKGVPETLRNAALRRMWALDPAIRDFAGHARDYAYDWNSPGGVPGTGPLSAADDVEAMVGRVFGDPPSPDEAGRADIEELSRDREGAGQLVASDGRCAEAGPDAAQHDEALHREPAHSPSDRDGPMEESAGPGASVPQPTAAEDPGGMPGVRRHGGAKPL
jgi:Protein of unknown function (DUF3306)